MTHQEAENLQEGLNKMSATIKIFYDGLMRAGFDDGHAMFLTNEFMKATINGISEKTVAAAMEYLKNK